MEKIKIIKKEDKLYPKKLLEIKNPPEQLYVLGDEKLLNKRSIAIIGSRDCSFYGYEQAKKFAKEISKEGICIVSGMAIGIDSAAHIGSKGELGKTIAVLGSGFNNIFPKENEALFHEIIEQGGAVITEYEPNTESASENFRNRNRIVSGLSDGVLVVEAKARSGTSITSKYARQQGKELFCIPSNLDTTTGVGTGKLIQKGAKLVLTPNDILSYLNIKSKEKNVTKDKKVFVDKKYREVYNSLSKIPINVNEICKNTNKDIIEVNTTLTMLELEGAVKQVGINEFIKV